MAHTSSPQPPLLTRLRRQPPEARRAVAKVVAGTVTAVVLVGWLIVKTTTFSIPAAAPALMEGQAAAIELSSSGVQIRDAWNRILKQNTAALRSATSAEAGSRENLQTETQGSESR